MTTERPDFVARLIQRRPELAAEVLERQSAESAAALLAQLPAAVAAATLACMLPRAATACLTGLGDADAPAILAELNPVTAAALLRGLPEDTIDALLADAPDRVAKPLRFVLQYPRLVIGAWMQVSPFLLPEDVRVEDALALARAGAHDLDRVVFVVDRQQRLRGAVPAAALLREAPDRELSGLVRKAPFVLHSRMGLRAAADHPGWARWDPLPVTNRHRRVVGVMHFADLRAALGEMTGQGLSSERFVSGSLLELMDVSWQGLSDLLEGALRTAPVARAAAPPAPRDE